MKLVKYSGQVPLLKRPHFAVVGLDSPGEQASAVFSCAFVVCGWLLLFGMPVRIWAASSVEH